MPASLNTRRSFLGLLASVPGVSLLLPAGSAAAQQVPAARAAAVGATVVARDVLSELGLRTFINAAGTYTAMTGSLMRTDTMAAIHVASKRFCMLDDLQDAVGKRIAQLLECEAAMVSAGCASALSLATAACVAGTNRDRIRRIPDTTGMKNEVIIQRTHRVGYDHAVRNAGVTMIEVETAAELEAAVNDRTAMMFFFNAADPRGRIKREQFVRLARKHNVPTLIDAAADVPPVENLFKYTRMGFDLVAFSGGKGLRGPQSSGLLLGRADLIAAARLNNSPNGDSLCRTNKVNKEEIVGLLVALEHFLAQDHDAVWADWEARCKTITDAVADIPTVTVEQHVGEIANAVPALTIDWDHDARNLTPQQAVERLRTGNPSIEPAPGSRRRLGIGVWMMEPGEAEIVARRLREVLSA